MLSELEKKERDSMSPSVSFFYGLHRRFGKKRNVYIIGFHKCGTSSLGKALQILGYNVCGSLKEIVGYEALSNKEQMLEFIWNKSEGKRKKFNAFQDTPWFLFYKEFYEKDPNGFFILNSRNTESWIKSYRRHFKNKKWKYHNLIYGSKYETLEDFEIVSIYEAHYSNVKSFFSDKNASFIELSLEKDFNWTTLCTFLNTKKPIVSFPIANKANVRRPVITLIKSLYKFLYKK